MKETDLIGAESREKPETRTLTVVTRSPLGWNLKNPIALTEDQARRLRGMGKGLADYIIGGCSLYKPKLAPFILEHEPAAALARYLYRYRSKSAKSLLFYSYRLQRFSEWLEKTPTQLLVEVKDPEGTVNPKALTTLSRTLEGFVDHLEDEGASPSYIRGMVAAVKTFYLVNGVKVTLPFRLPNRPVHRDRSPTPEELQRLIDIGDLREKVIVSTLALGAFRESTLAALRYRHVKADLEREIVPVHVHVEAEITKGKYHDYDTFLGQEAVDYLKAYLDLRRRGSPCGKILPETIHDETPLIRDGHSSIVRPLSSNAIYRIVHRLYIKASLVPRGWRRRHSIWVHSIRKFFRTQLAALGVQPDYIEYMMGHTISTYHDIQMKGVDFLRNVYAASGLSIRPKTSLSKIEALKEIIRAWGMNPEEILTREALSTPHRAYAGPLDREEDHVKALSNALKEMLRKELLDPRAIQPTV